MPHAHNLPDGVFIADEKNAPYLAGQGRTAPGAWGGGRKLTLGLVLLLGLGFVALLLASQSGVFGGAQIDDGREVDGIVVSKTTRDGAFTIRYAFVVETERYELSSSVSESRYDALNANDRLRVRYNTTNPNEAELVENGLESGINSLVLGLLCGVPGVLLLLAEYARSRLYRVGQIIVAEVVSVDKSFDPEVAEYVLKLSYQFTTPDTAAKIRDRILLQRYDEDFPVLPSIGTPLAVLYLNETRYEVL